MDTNQPQPEVPREDLDDPALIAALAASVPERPSPETRTHHLAAIGELAGAHAHEAPARRQQAAPTTWRARVRRVAGLTALKIGLSGAAVALATGGGLAVTGHLPDPAQRVVADLADNVGIRLPSPPPRSAQPPAHDRGDVSPAPAEDAAASPGGPADVPATGHDERPGTGSEMRAEPSQRPEEVPGEDGSPDDRPSQDEDVRRDDDAAGSGNADDRDEPGDEPRARPGDADASDSRGSDRGQRPDEPSEAARSDRPREGDEADDNGPQDSEERRRGRSDVTSANGSGGRSAETPVRPTVPTDSAARRPHIDQRSAVPRTPSRPDADSVETGASVREGDGTVAGREDLSRPSRLRRDDLDTLP